MKGEMITLAEYIERNNLAKSPVYLKASQGHFKTAKKVGRIWLINENEPYIDYRFKDGKEKK
ncbi:MAG: hypothetical protein GX928_02585 [Ruminococcaceae bacterium]|jgi:hypothetical protein|nr:hypothetical protein [Oscillospiraceae bacterium]